MSRFYEIEPTRENLWRAVILFGRNTASYKFALAKALYDLHAEQHEIITLERLAEPYAQHLCEHLKSHPKQITSAKSTFLDALQQFNQREITREQMLEQTVRLGFNNVIDAFHNVHGGEIGKRFFLDERKESKGIRLTDEFFQLAEHFQFNNLREETDARWRLVESAWENKLAQHLMLVEYENDNQNLIGVSAQRRVPLTSARPALNGYQKGRCFYCYQEITTTPGDEDLADVDHFFAHKLKNCNPGKPIDGVANLVLSCRDCNRGENGKFDRLPSVDLLERLYSRNEYLISSHHPLRETLISQTGTDANKRQNYLQDAYNCATLYLGGGQKWEPQPRGIAIF
jgi:hypothetical protein